MHSQDFERFYESCFGETFGIVHDGVDGRALLNLKGDERKEAENLLVAALGTNNDTYSRPVIALGLLGTPEAVGPLKLRLINSSGSDRIEIALALFRIEKSPEAEKIILDELKVSSTSNPSETTQRLAVNTLPYLGRTPQVVRALLEVMSYNDNMVGYSAAAGLHTLFSEDKAVRDLLAEVLLVQHDAHKADFVGRGERVRRAEELIRTRMATENLLAILNKAPDVEPPESDRL